MFHLHTPRKHGRTEPRGGDAEGVQEEYRMTQAGISVFDVGLSEHVGAHGGFAFPGETGLRFHLDPVKVLIVRIRIWLVVVIPQVQVVFVFRIGIVAQVSPSFVGFGVGYLGCGTDLDAFSGIYSCVSGCHGALKYFVVGILSNLGTEGHTIATFLLCHARRGILFDQKPLDFPFVTRQPKSGTVFRTQSHFLCQQPLRGAALATTTNSTILCCFTIILLGLDAILEHGREGFAAGTITGTFLFGGFHGCVNFGI
mmetsp:Transcript_11606/g.14177  ORF Transcript_11606/g.14177 Transcript_11606/m.14177 type:complete len:255 (-) Transcript_11606:382-1146(-)